MEDGWGHEPVLRGEVAQLLAPAGRKILLDCTVGLGGHAEALLAQAGEQARLIGIDLDEANLRRAKERLARFGPRVRLFQANFADVGEVLAEADAGAVDLLLADLGISSAQLDDADRGLSFQADGPLDMRMGPQIETTAAELVNELDETSLANLIYRYGEERFSRRIARAITARRQIEPIERTGQLAEIVARAYPAQARRSRRGVHPATRTFQALRIAVNGEMENLESLLAVVPEILAPGGRAGFISFHSLEDRPVKQAVAGWVEEGLVRSLTKKPVTPTQDEIDANPRSRSAKLRAVEKLPAQQGAEK